MLPCIRAQAESHVIELAGFPVTPPVFSISEDPSLLILLYGLQICPGRLLSHYRSDSHLDLQIFEDVDPASPAEVGRGTREGVLLQVKITESYHEP